MIPVLAADSAFAVALLGLAAFTLALYLIASLVLGNHAKRQARIATVMRREGLQGVAARRRVSRSLSDHPMAEGRSDMILQQAGLYEGPARYAMITLGFGVVLATGVVLLGAPLESAIFIGAVGSMAGFALFVARSRRRRLEAIEREFPAALDVMVRSLRAGLPMDEALRTVAQEATPIVANEFRVMVNEMALGLSLADSVKRLADRVAVSDVRIFAVVLSLQRSSGGSASAALEAVAETLRSRRTLSEKISIMSSEARASAGIIASLPAALIAILYVVSPDYIGLLFTTTPGQVTAVATVMWMLLGVQVMRAMINFDA